MTSALNPAKALLGSENQGPSLFRILMKQSGSGHMPAFPQHAERGSWQQNPPTNSVCVYSRPCNTEQTRQLPYSLLKIMSVSSQGDLWLVAGYHELLQAVASHHSGMTVDDTSHPVCRIYLWVGHSGSSYVFDLWDSCYHKEKSICKLGRRTKTWFIRLY